MVNIFGSDEDIRNRTSTFCTAIPFVLRERRLVNFGLLITEIKQWNHTHSNQLFGRLYFGP